MSAEQSDTVSTDHETVPVELRGVDDADDATLSDVWVAEQPIGNLLDSCRQTISTLETRQEELEAENEQLRDRIATLEGRVTPDPSSKDYDEKTRDEKVREVRLSCARKATQQGGKGSLEYTDVLTLFDHRPSAGHAYTLLRLAAELAGFSYVKRDGENDQLRVTLDDVKDDSIFHGVNKDHNNEGPQQ